MERTRNLVAIHLVMKWITETVNFSKLAHL